MTQLAEQQAVDATPAPVEGDTAAQMYADDAPAIEGDENQPGSPIEGEEGEQLGEVEPEQPAIDAPASWAADAQEVFATLPPEAQKIISDREKAREQFVNAKAQEVVQVKQQAGIAVAEQVTQHTRQYAEQLQQYAAMFTPQPPDPRLLQGSEQDRAIFYSQEAAFREASAQQQQLQQQAADAQRQAEFMEQAQRQQELLQDAAQLREFFPQVVDPASFAALQQELEPVARAMGYDDERINLAGAVDFRAVSRAAEWKKSHDKLMAMNKAKMIPVREAKNQPRPNVPGTPQQGQQQGQDVLATLYPNDVRK